MFGLPDTEIKPIAASMTAAEVTEAVTRNFANTTAAIKELHAKVAAGERTDAEIKRAVDKAAADIDAVVKEATAWQARADVAKAQVGQGSSVYKNFARVKPDDLGCTVRLFDTRVKVLGEHVTSPGLLSSESIADDWHFEAKARLIAAQIATTGQGGNAKSWQSIREKAPKAAAALAYHLASGPIGLTIDSVERIFTGATDAAGGYAIPDEVLIPLGYVGQTGDATLFMSDLPTENMGPRTDYPVISRLPRPHGVGAATGDDPAAYTASSATLDKLSITPKALANRLVVDDFSMEDAVSVTMADFLSILARSMRFGMEDCILNGQSGVTNTDTIASWAPGSIFSTTGAGGAGDHRNQIEGLRGKALDLSNTVDMSTFSYAKILELLSKLDSPFNMSTGRRFVTDARTVLLKILALEQVATVEKYGPRAAVITGDIASIAGVPIRVSPFCTSDLASTGRYTGSGSTSGLLLVDTSQHRLSIRRALGITTERKPGTGVVEMVAVQRFNRRSLQPSSAKTVAYGINI